MHSQLVETIKRHALHLNSAIQSSPSNAELHRLFAQSLYLEGIETNNHDSLLIAVQELAAAKDYDSEDLLIRSRYSKYIADVQI